MEDTVSVYTTRADTLFGLSYVVISPEHPLLEKWKDRIGNWDEVAAYQAEAARKSDFERGELNKEKTGVRLEGVLVTNPANGETVPMFVSDYVLMGYGTGIVMGVPGHDQRDWDFATKFGLPIIPVVEGGDISKSAYTTKDDGIMINSGFLNGMTVKAPGLGVQPPALLGRTHPPGELRKVRLGPPAGVGAAPAPSRGGEL